jgi:hypothetical protein
MLVHLHKGLEVIGVMPYIEIAPAATGAFVMQNAGKEGRFVVAMLGIDRIYCAHMILVL